MDEINEFTYCTIEDDRSQRILELIKDESVLKEFFISLSELVDNYLKDMYDLSSSESDIEQDEPNEPYDSLETEDDY